MCVILGFIAQVYCLLLSFVTLQLLSISIVYCWWAFAMDSVERRKPKNKSRCGLCVWVGDWCDDL